MRLNISYPDNQLISKVKNTYFCLLNFNNLCKKFGKNFFGFRRRVLNINSFLFAIVGLKIKGHKIKRTYEFQIVTTLSKPVCVWA